ncbi:glycerophosphodiester phosphodiesterase family protein [Erythrobacter sp. SG61-1L]|uniref:glycerophosphodiester phosphodiesterase family protein n=1 Tax=Erythrobacter sp. SG61-1L TaxID=1603897 RepID=UPI0006C8EC40|nr:glycerophosphodiester phosphodiesterase family protein [Erythrobacter sp. SG61-1L]
MFRNLLKSAVLLALFSVASPSLAAPFCGETPQIAALQEAWHDPTGRVMIASHRGGHLRSPENSLAAVDEAVAAGADFVEIDVRVSRDGVPFIMHDGTVDRTTDGSGKGEDMTFAQLRALRLKGGDTPPPTLLEMLMHTCGRVLVDLDMKTDRFAPVLAVVDGLGMADQVMMFDSDSDVLRNARALSPALPVMTRLQKDVPMAEKNRALAPVAIVHGDEETLTPAMKAAIADMPARIWANSLGDLDKDLGSGATACPRLKSLLGQGASVIQTDQPRLLRARLSACGEGGDEKR